MAGYGAVAARSLLRLTPLLLLCPAGVTLSFGYPVFALPFLLDSLLFHQRGISKTARRFVMLNLSIALPLSLITLFRANAHLFSFSGNFSSVECDSDQRAVLCLQDPRLWVD